MSYKNASYSDFAHAEGPLGHANFSLPVETTNSLNLIDVVKENQPESPANLGTPVNPFTELTQFLKSIPENQKIDAKTLLETARDSETYQTLAPVLVGANSITRTGNHIDIERRGSEHITVARNILEGNASADSLNLEKQLSFDIGPDGKSVHNLQGLSVSVSAFGSGTAIPVRQIDASEGANKQPGIIAHIDNPLPPNAQNILSLPPTIAIPLESEQGKLKMPQPSSLFYSLAASAGNTLPGMLFSDSFHDLGDISLFAEKNPKWIHDVIKPMFEEIKKQALHDKAADAASGKGGGDKNGSVKHPDGTVTRDGAPQNSQPEKITGKGDYDQKITIDGKERHYSLHVPPDYDGSKPISLLLMLHGRGGDGKEFAERTHMNDKADKEGFAVAYPDATQWLGRRDLSAWDAANGLVPPGARANDLQFLRDVIDRSQSQLRIDPERIYMIGHSSGGMMTYLAASQMSDKLAAVGIVSSAMSGKEPKPKFPISVIATHGTDDEVIPINGLKNVPPILTELGIPTFNTPQFATDFWRRQDGITAPGTIEKDKDVTLKHFENTRNGTAVDELTLQNSGHTPDEKFHVYDRIWDFLKKHPKASGNTAPSNDPKDLVDMRPNPLRHIAEDIQKRGADGIAEDVSRICTEVVSLPDGSIYPSNLLNGVEEKLGSKLKNPVTDFIENSSELSKSGHHIQLKTSKPTQFPIDENVGIGSIQSLDLNNVEFNVDSVKGNPQISNIKGISLNGRVLGQDLTTKLNELTDKKDDKGRHTYNFNLDNPLPKPLRMLMFAPSTVNLGVQIDAGGNVEIANQSEFKQNLLGSNPITRGYIDEFSDAATCLRNPSTEVLRHLRRDVGITGSFMALGAFAPRYRIPISLIGGLLGAPAAVHFLHETFE